MAVSGTGAGARHGNWIAGSWRPAASGHEFVVESPLLEAPDAPRRWPRSGREDVDAAVAAAVGARAAWAREGAERRRREVVHLCAALEESLDHELAELLDVEDADLEAQVLLLTEPFRHGEASRYEDAFVRSGPLLARPDWRQLFRGYEATLCALAAGAPVVLVSDPAVPQLARALARAAEDAGLPAGVLGLVCDDGATAVRAALATGEFDALHASGDGSDLEELRALARRAPGPRRPERELPFGAGVDGAPRPVDADVAECGPALLLELVRSSLSVVRPARGLRREVDRVLDASLGRGRALDGVADGRIGAVLCPEEHFSAFTAQLLEQLDALELPLLGPLALDRRLGARLARVRELGLDEGATLLLGGEAAPAGPPEGARGASGGSIPSAAGGILVPTVFTNVEEHMQLLRATRPAPLLCLLRVPSEEAGDDLAARLDAC